MNEEESENRRVRPWLAYATNEEITLSEAVFALVNNHIETVNDIVNALESRGELGANLWVLKDRIQEGAFGLDSRDHYADPHNLTAEIIWLYESANKIERAKLKPLVQGLRSLGDKAVRANGACELARDIENQFVHHETRLSGLQ